MCLHAALINEKLKMFTVILFYFFTIWSVALSQKIDGINSSATADSITSTTDYNENRTQLTQFWTSIHRIEAIADGRFIQIADQIGQLSRELSQSSNQCYHVIEQAFRTGLNEKWSATMISSNALIVSSGTFINGLITDRYTSVGDFFDCYQLKRIKLNMPKQISFGGKYCLASLNTPQLGYYSKAIEKERFANVSGYIDGLVSDWLFVRNRFPRSFGICAPSICTEHELRLLIQKYFEQYLGGIDLKVGYCQIDKPKTFNFGFLLSLFILLITIDISVLATLIPKFIHFIGLSSSKVYPESVAQIMDCFNIERNCRALFSMSSHKDGHEYDLGFIHGLKAFLMLFVVGAHSNMFAPIVLFARLSTFERFPSYFHALQANFFFMGNFMSRAHLLVDYFFTLSGFLVTYLILSRVKKCPNFLPYVLIRWIHLAPSVMAILCLTIVLQKFGVGPLFHEALTDPYVKPCYDYWWAHLLFINNYWDFDQMCGPSVWFVAADFQLHILLYAVLVLYFRKRLLAWASSIGIVITAVAIFLASNLTGLGPGVPKLDYAFNFQYPAPLAATRFYYTSFQTHTLSYFFGVLIAIRLLSRSTPIVSTKLKDSLIILFAIMTAALMLAPIKAIETDQNDNRDLSYLIRYMIFYVFTVLTEGFLIYFLIISKRSPVKRFLSAKILIPVDRLTYGIYLLNPLINWYCVQLNWSTPPLTVFHGITISMATYFICLILSMYLYVFFQAPFYNLSRLLLAKQEAPKKQSIDGHPSIEFVEAHNDAEYGTNINRDPSTT